MRIFQLPLERSNKKSRRDKISCAKKKETKSQKTREVAMCVENDIHD